MIDPDRMCMNCFSHLDEPQGVCPRCGFDNAACENEYNQLECGSILSGAFLIGRSLGQGGFGITYAGFNLKLKLKVAIKEYFPERDVVRDRRTHKGVIPRPGSESYFEKGKEKFLLEAQTLALFYDDPCIVNVLDYFTENGTAYIVMSFVEGENLRAYAGSRGGKLPAREVLAILRPLFASLKRVHAEKLLHRDISPDNIMRRPDGSLVLIDFGAAREFSSMGEHANTIFLKHGYAPEEQYRTHGKQGAWTDVYALCATIYRLTTGETPPSAFDRMNGDVPLVPPNELGADFLPAEQAAILHGLALHAEVRIQTIQQLQDELESQSELNKPTTQMRTAVQSVTGITLDVPAQPEKKAAVERLEEFEEPSILARKGEPQAKKKRSAPTFARGKLKYMIGGTIAIAVLAVALTLLFSQNGAKNESGASTQPPVAADVPAAAAAQPPVEPTATPRIFAEVGTVVEGRLAAGSDYCLVLLDNGKVACFGGQTTGIYEDVQRWEDIVWISGYDSHAVGLRKNGTLAIAGADEDKDLDVLDLSNVAQVVTGCHYTVVLTEEGNVYYRGVHLHNLLDCEKWSNVKKLIGGDDHLAAIFSDGTMKAVGYSGYGQLELSDVTDAIGGTVSNGTTFILHADGSVTPRGENFCNEDDVGGWSNIIYVDGGDEHTLGLRSDGRIKIAGVSEKNVNIDEAQNWTNIVAVCSGQYHIIAIDQYGTLHITGNPQEGYTSGDGLSIWDL